MLRGTGSLFGRGSGRVNRALLVGLVAITVFFAALVFVLRNWRGEVSAPEATAAAPAGQSPSADGDFTGEPDQATPMRNQDRQILNRHFSAVGGIHVLSSMSSFRVSGDLILPDGEVRAAMLIKKGKNFERITIRTPGQVEVSVVTPDDKWRATWKMGELHEVHDLGPLELLEMQHNAPVINELYMAIQTGTIMQYLGQRDFNYRMAHVFEVTGGPRHSIRFFVDPESFLNIGREDRVFEPDGTLVITRRLYSEHLQANGVTIPGKVETSINDVRARTFDVHLAELNPGVLDSVFARPELPVKR